MLELDHVIVFLRGPDGVEALRPRLAGLVLDEGTRHAGQGTRNRRIVFPDSYVELLWVDSPAQARASGLRFEDRCRGEACPFGVVLRGALPERAGFVEYAVPGGPTLLVLDDPRMPLLAVRESGARHPARPEHVNATSGIVHAEIASAEPPPDLGVPGVAFLRGEPALTLALAGVREPLRFPGRLEAIPITPAAAVPVGGGVIVREHALVVTQPVEGTFVAFSSVCPHRQCAVKAVAAGTINCFCHGSRFRIADGSVAGGPAQEPLSRVDVVVTDGVVSLG